MGQINPKNIQNIIKLDHIAQISTLHAAQLQNNTANEKADIGIANLLNSISK